MKAKKKEITLTINGRSLTSDVPMNWSLQEMLKHTFALTGTKRSCGRGECGGCTVIMDGMAVNACLTLAVECDGSVIQTVEGEATEGQLSALQKAFVKHGAVQCGFCTPGMIMSARALLNRNSNPTDEEITEAIAGNLCRCTGYEAIIEAIKAVSKEKA